jgi:hypothetical protein
MGYFGKLDPDPDLHFSKRGSGSALKSKFRSSKGLKIEPLKAVDAYNGDVEARNGDLECL